jgi:hypothetical protein
MSGIDKLQSTDIVNEARLPNVASTLRETQDSLNARFDKGAAAPLRLFASNPVDSKLNIGPNQTVSGDGSALVFYPVDGVNQTFTQMTVDFQTGALSVAGQLTLLGQTFALPASVTGQFRRVAFVYQTSTGKVDSAFSPSVASYALLQDTISLFSNFSGGTPLGYIDLVGSATSTPGAYKSASSSASSATNVIQSAVSSVPSIFRYAPFTPVASGDASILDAALRDELAGSQYDMYSAVIFLQAYNNLTDTAVATGTLAGKNYQMTTGQIFASKQLLDSEYLTDPAGVYPKVLSEVNLTAYWDIARVDPAATYAVSRDGGNEYQTVTMARVGQTNGFQGNLVFTEEAAQQALITQASSSTQKELNLTTTLKIGNSFTVTGGFAVKSIDLFVVKTGLPLGKFYVALVKTSSNLPSLNFIDQLAESAAIDISTLTSGTVNVALPTTALAAGTYQFVIRGDAAYQANFVAATTSISFSNATTGTQASILNATTGLWTASATDSIKYTLKGSQIDLRVKITASTGTVALQGLGAFLGRNYNGIATGATRLETVTFNSATDNRSTFTLTKFLPDPRTLTVEYPQTGQVFSYPAFQVNGYQVIFPTDTFKNRGIDVPVTLNFRQTVGQNVDASDLNGANISALSQWAASGLLDDVVILGKITCPFTTVTGRALMTDLSQDLLPRFGVDRVMTQALVALSGELGPNGEPVYKPVNDKHNLMRFIGGGWQTGNDLYGQRAITGQNSATYAEITFYGTGLNVLGAANDNQNQSYSVDGGATVQYIGSVGTVSILGARAYSPNQIFPVVSGLALGIHTVKLTVSAGYFDLNGFEILNEGLKTTGATTSGSTQITGLSSTLGLVIGSFVSGAGIPSGATVTSIVGTTATISIAATATASGVALSFAGALVFTPGSTATKGKKLSTSQLAFGMYNSGFETGTLGTKGGRALVYQKSDGSVAKAVTPTSASALTLTNTDHTAEEPNRTYFWREFGSGRSDDFSTVSTGRATAFTLDDGTTCLTSTNASANFINGMDAFTPTTTNDYFVFTFVGTGLDILATPGLTTGTLSTYTVQVDGAAAVSVTFDQSATVYKYIKIASGLPYGTHTVKLFCTALGTTRVYWSQFVTYTPKKPALPSGAIELADYCVMADYVFAPGNLAEDSVGTGTLSKTPSREWYYTGSWNALQLYSGAVDTQTASSANGSTYQLSFFGTGIVLSGTYGTSGSAVIQIDGANYTGAATPGTGAQAGTWTPGTSTWVQTGGGGGRLSISGLTLGLHTIKLTITQVGGFYTRGAAVITPIHSVKINGPYVAQNSLSVGSQGVSDNRLFPPRFNDLSTSVFAVGVTSGSTTSTTPAPVGDLGATIFMKEDGFVDIHAIASITISATNYAVPSVAINGIAYPPMLNYQVTATGEMISSTACLVPLAKGFHHIRMFYNLNSASGTLNWSTNATGDQRFLNVTTKHLRS